MACRNAVEFESTVNARLFFVTGQRVSGAGAKERLKVIADVALSSLMWELMSNNSIPPQLVKGDPHKWAEEMIKFAEISIDINADPQIIVNVKKMAEKIYEGQSVRVSTASVLAELHKTRGTLRDEDLALDLERRALEQVLTPQGSIHTPRRANVAAEIQRNVAQIQKRREEELGQERKKQKEEEAIEENGFGRKVELD